MAVNKVNFGGDTLMDLSGDSVSPNTLLSGETAHDKAGNLIRGTFVPQNTTYALSKSGSTIKLTGSDGSESKVTNPDIEFNGLAKLLAHSDAQNGWIMDFQGTDIQSNSERIRFDKTGGIYAYSGGSLVWQMKPYTLPLPISSGGTGGTTRAEASLGVNVIGNNSATILNNTADILANNFVVGYFSSATPDSVSKPTGWGHVLSIGAGGHWSQLWMALSNGDMFHRGGQANTDASNQAWKRIYDTDFFAFKKVSVTFSGNAGSIACSGVIPNSTIFAQRTPTSGSGGNFGDIGAAWCESAGTVKLGSGVNATLSGSVPVSLWWSKY